LIPECRKSASSHSPPCEQPGCSGPGKRLRRVHRARRARNKGSSRRSGDVSATQDGAFTLRWLDPMHPKDLACQFRFRHNVAVHIPNRLNICRTPSEDGPGDYAGDARVSVMDRRGNVTGRTYAGPGGTGIPGSLVMPADPATNRLSGGFYDGLGNQTRIEQNGTVLNLTYLDQGHVLETWSAPSGRGSEESMEMLQYRYYYDAGGKRRIKAKASDGLTNFQEDASYYFYEGESLACQLDIGELAPEEEGFYEPKFLMLDHLGSTRAEITFEGAGLTPTVSGSYDYMPYGQFINVLAETTEQVCFTGKPRDPESGLDEFGPRFFNGFNCRFIGVDLMSVTPARVKDPQQLNLYTYVRNNPINFVDPTGMVIDTSQLNSEELEKWNKVVSLANQKDENNNYVNQKLHELYNLLENDPRTFQLINGNRDPADPLTAQEGGKFTITKIDGTNDFSEAKISLNFKAIANIKGVTQGAFDPSFKKYEGLLRDFSRRLAETFGHEAGHAEFALAHLSDAVQLQQMMNERKALMKASGYPIPPDVIQKSKAIDSAIIPSERHAQQVQKIINGELRKNR